MLNARKVDSSEQSIRIALEIHSYPWFGKLEEINMAQPTYAENLLFHAGFQFEHRNGDRLDLSRISQADIAKIVEDVDTETLSSFLEDITFCEITQEDLHRYSDNTFVKLFQISQLIIEYLVDAQDTLSANLNGLAKKYAAKKREIETLSKNLARQDAEVAELKDELFYHRKYVRSSMSLNSAASDEEAKGASRVDPALYPSQERRPSAAPGASLEEISSESSSAASRNQQAQDGTVRLHVVSSTHAIYLQMNVEDTLSVQNLKNKLVGRLLAAGHYNVNHLSLYHKDEELDSSLTVKQCHFENDAAVVLMPKSVQGFTTAAAEAPQINAEEVAEEVAATVEASVKAPAIEPVISIESKLEERLEELTAITTKAQEELVQATRTLQFQVSMQESNKESFSVEIREQLKSLDGALRDEVQRQVQDALNLNDIQKHSGGKAMSPLSKLNMGELVETDGDVEDEIEEKQEEDSLSTNESSSSDEEEENAIGDIAGSPYSYEGKVLGVPLKVDTTAEVYDREMSPFNPPSQINLYDHQIEVTTEEKEDNSPQEGDVEENETLSASMDRNSSMRHSPSSTQLALSLRSSNLVSNEIDDRTPTPSKGYLDRKVPPEELASAASPSHWSGAAVTSSAEKKHHEVKQFCFSDYESSNHGYDDNSAQGVAEVLAYNPDEYNTNDVSIPDTTLNIAAGRATTNDSSLQSIDISHSEFVSNANEMEVESMGEPDGKKNMFSCFQGKSKKKMSIKKSLSKMKLKRSNGKGKNKSKNDGPIAV